VRAHVRACVCASPFLRCIAVGLGWASWRLCLCLQGQRPTRLVGATSLFVVFFVGGGGCRGQSAGVGAGYHYGGGGVVVAAAAAVRTAATVGSGGRTCERLSLLLGSGVLFDALAFAPPSRSLLGCSRIAHAWCCLLLLLLLLLSLVVAAAVVVVAVVVAVVVVVVVVVVAWCRAVARCFGSSTSLWCTSCPPAWSPTSTCCCARRAFWPWYARTSNQPCDNLQPIVCAYLLCDCVGVFFLATASTHAVGRCCVSWR
jgi:hypothetical protein